MRGNALFANKESAEHRGGDATDSPTLLPLPPLPPLSPSPLTVSAVPPPLLPVLCLLCVSYAGAVLCYSDGVLLCPSSCVDLLSILYNNRAIAHLQCQEWVEAIRDCTSSLGFRATSKALLRRSIAYEKTEKWGEAIADLQAAIAMGGDSRENEERLRRLEREKKAADERLKEEMMGKLKDLGNGILGKFGMSLDNFKAVKDEKTGSYSLSFNK